MSQTPDEYRDEPPEIGVMPNPSAAKTIGILNVIFASLLLLCGVCGGLQLGFQSAFAPVFGAQQRQQLEAQFQAQRALELQQLADKEKKATTDKEKQEFQSQRKKLETQPLPKMPDFSKMYGTDDPRVFGIWMVDVLTGLLLNLLMLGAGIGLLMVKEWGRVLGIWVAAIKILRLVILYTFSIIVTVPIVTQRFAQTMEEMGRNMPQGGGPQAGQVAAVMGTFATIFLVSMIVLGAIYPAVVLIVLTRPSVRAACRQRAEPEEYT